jgi:hypothetical protein
MAADHDVRPVSDRLLQAILSHPSPRLRIDWHLGERDFTPEGLPRLLDVLERTRDEGLHAFVLDRPRRPIALAEGLDRASPAALVHVGLNLPALARQGGMLADAERYCQRLGSLVRLALSAAVQKRDHLRPRQGESRPDLTSGFLLDRARFVVVPLGLDEVVRLFTGWGLSNGGDSLRLGRRILDRIDEVLHQERRWSQLDGCIDGPITFTLGEAVAGPTPWDPTASIVAQLKAGSVLHAATRHGTLALFLPEERPTVEQIADWLRMAWSQTEVVRLRLMTAH